MAGQSPTQLTQGVRDMFHGRSRCSPSRKNHGSQDSLSQGGNSSAVAEKRKFLRDLTVSLVTYGCSCPRAEYLINQAAERLHVNLDICIFASVVMIVFPGTGDPSQFHTSLDRVGGYTDVARLQAVDELANSVGFPSTPLSIASQRLSYINNRPQLYGSWCVLLGYAVTAPTAALLFFDGNLWDALFSLVMGVGVFVLELYSSRITAARNIQEFLSAAFVSFLARVVAVEFKHLNVCYFSMAISGLVWLLPGEDLTIGISELVETSLVSGASRMARALVKSLQLGFGLAVGEKLVLWFKDPVEMKCKAPEFSAWWDILWFLGFIFAVNILLEAKPWQWPCMTIAAGAGVLADKLTESWGTEISGVISSFAIGLTGSLCSFLSKDISWSMTLAGIQVILPGSLGVQGAESLLTKDALSGVRFVISMIYTCLSICLGLLLSKILVKEIGQGVATLMHFGRHTVSSPSGEQNYKEVKASEEEEDEELAV